MKSIDERRAMLQAGINSYIAKGFRVTSQTDTTAQLVKPKKFSLLACVLLLGVFYIPWYLFRKDKTVYLQVDELGSLTET